MIKNLLQEGFELKTQGHYKHAIECFYKALEIDNESPELLYEIADLYYLIGNYERAVNYVEQILLKNPTHISSLQLLKKIFIDKKAYVEAEQTLRNIYFISKSDKDLTELFKLLFEEEEYDKILEYCNESDDSDVMYEIAKAKFCKNDLAESLEIVNKILENNNESKNLILKGRILLKLNRDDECLNILKSIKIDDTDEEVLSFAGLVYQRFCDYDNALSCFKKAISNSKKVDECYYNCASTYFKMGEIKLAQKYYNLAISVNPDNPNYHFALANLYYSERQYKRALEELKYDFFEARLLKAIILFDTGYVALAKKEIDELEKIQPENHLILKYKEEIENELRI